MIKNCCIVLSTLADIHHHQIKRHYDLKMPPSFNLSVKTADHFKSTIWCRWSSQMISSVLNVVNGLEASLWCACEYWQPLGFLLRVSCWSFQMTRKKWQVTLKILQEILTTQTKREDFQGKEGLDWSVTHVRIWNVTERSKNTGQAENKSYQEIQYMVLPVSLMDIFYICLLPD